MSNDPPRPGVTSEVGRLRTVMLHRPGPELKRLTPRNNDRLLFDGIPWVSRAQEEHDGFAEALRDRDVEVLYLIDLLTETLESRVNSRLGRGSIRKSSLGSRAVTMPWPPRTSSLRMPAVR